MDIRHMPGNPEVARAFRWSDLLDERASRPEPPSRRARPRLAALVLVGLALGSLVWTWRQPEGRGDGASELWPHRFDLLAAAFGGAPAAGLPLRELAQTCRARGGAESDALLFALLWTLTEHEGGAEAARELVAALDADAFPASARLAAEW